MKKQLWTCLLLLVVFAAFCPAFVMATQTMDVSAVSSLSANQTEPMAEVSNTTTLLFLGNQNIAPVVYLDGTIPSGVAVDIVHGIANQWNGTAHRTIHRPFEWRPDPV